MNGFKIYQMLEIDCLLKLKPEEILREILIKMKKKKTYYTLKLLPIYLPIKLKLQTHPFCKYQFFR